MVRISAEHPIVVWRRRWGRRRRRGGRRRRRRWRGRRRGRRRRRGGRRRRRRRRLLVAAPDEVRIVATTRARRAPSCELCGRAQAGTREFADRTGLDKGLPVGASKAAVGPPPHRAPVILLPGVRDPLVSTAAHLVLLVDVGPFGLLGAPVPAAALDVALRGWVRRLGICRGVGAGQRCGARLTPVSTHNDVVLRIRLGHKVVDGGAVVDAARAGVAVARRHREAAARAFKD